MAVTNIKNRDVTAPPVPEEERAPGYVLELSKPVEAHGETITVLRFREPTARDLLNVGNPVVFDPISTPPKVIHDEKRMTAMMSLLAAVPPSTIAAMNPRDWVTAAWGLTPFFVPIAAKI